MVSISIDFDRVKIGGKSFGLPAGRLIVLMVSRAYFPPNVSNLASRLLAGFLMHI